MKYFVAFFGSATALIFLLLERIRRRRKHNTAARETLAACDSRRETVSKSRPILCFDDDRLYWHNGAPLSWSIERENRSGTTTLKISPNPTRDYWSRTFYTPLLVKHDAQTYLADTRWDEEIAMTTAFTLQPVSQFDQAGIMVRVDDDCWVKAGVEYTDGVSRLSCVVTNEGYSDWYVPPLPFHQTFRDSIDLFA